MNKQRYIAPITEVIYCGNFCETLPVYFSKEGPGDVGAKEMDFGNDWDSDWGFGSEDFKFKNVWEEME